MFLNIRILAICSKLKTSRAKRCGLKALNRRLSKGEKEDVKVKIPIKKGRRQFVKRVVTKPLTAV